MWTTAGYITSKKATSDCHLWLILLFAGQIVPTWYAFLKIKGDNKVIIHIQIIGRRKKKRAV
ncbi:hypothetical protein G9P44_001853 [Scheffersomyces stipitis]|nr:hypothetical protein G9P44_005153 [Scheffersomyces stipitis]KAG2735639.1 hypothetical protein G9P44_001853 [Scheffersomyces stipitis]